MGPVYPLSTGLFPLTIRIPRNVNMIHHSTTVPLKMATGLNPQSRGSVVGKSVASGETYCISEVSVQRQVGKWSEHGVRARVLLVQQLNTPEIQQVRSRRDPGTSVLYPSSSNGTRTNTTPYVPQTLGLFLTPQLACSDYRSFHKGYSYLSNSKDHGPWIMWYLSSLQIDFVPHIQTIQSDVLIVDLPPLRLAVVLARQLEVTCNTRFATHTLARYATNWGSIKDGVGSEHYSTPCVSKGMHRSCSLHFFFWPGNFFHAAAPELRLGLLVVHTHTSSSPYHH